MLGPYAEAGRAGYKAYWHAAESVLAVRRLAGPEAASGTPADSQAKSQLADLCRWLPDAERAAVAGLVAAAPEADWLGAIDGAYEHAAAQRVHARQLAAVLASRGYLIDDCALPQRHLGAGGEPVEAEFARRGQPRHVRVVRTGRTGFEGGSRPADTAQQQVPQPTITPAGPVPVR